MTKIFGGVPIIRGVVINVLNKKEKNLFFTVDSGAQRSVIPFSIIKELGCEPSQIAERHLCNGVFGSKNVNFYSNLIIRIPIFRNGKIFYLESDIRCPIGSITANKTLLGYNHCKSLKLNLGIDFPTDTLSLSESLNA